MTNRDLYKIWAPKNSKWSAWVRPVPFCNIGDQNLVFSTAKFEVYDVKCMEKYHPNYAIVVDYPSNESISMALGFAKLGYKPVPLFNGTNEQLGVLATTDNHSIEYGLLEGGEELKKIQIKDDALPVFIVDLNRKNRSKANIGVFDNSWDIYDQDMPTAEFLMDNNVKGIIVVTPSYIWSDLNYIMYKYQSKGLEILRTNGFELPERIKVKKNSGNHLIMRAISRAAKS